MNQFSGIILQDWDKILLTKKITVWPNDGWRGVPGGHIQTNQSVSDSAIQKIKSEIWITIKNQDLSDPILICSFCEEEKKHFSGWYFLCNKREWNIINNEPHKCSKISRFQTSQLPKETILPLKLALQKIQESQTYHEFRTEECWF